MHEPPVFQGVEGGVGQGDLAQVGVGVEAVDGEEAGVVRPVDPQGMGAGTLPSGVVVEVGVEPGAIAGVHGAHHVVPVGAILGEHLQRLALVGKKAVEELFPVLLAFLGDL